MAKSRERISDKEKQLILKTLHNVGNEFVDSGGVVAFVKNVLTEGEQITIGRRILIAQRLLAGQTQFEIMNDLSVSPNTITRTRRWLEGQIPEYSTVLKQSEQAAKVRAKNRAGTQRKSLERVDPLSFAGLQKKYPLHFVLFTLANQALKKSK